MPINSCDVLILGGGCGGLGIGYFYSMLAGHQSIITLEQRSHYEDDRTWCFWLTDADMPHRDIIFSQWHRWRISENNDNQIHKTQSTPYVMIKSNDYYDKAQKAIEHDSRQQLYMNTRVIGIKKNAGGYVIETDNGEFTAKHVIDTRPDVNLVKDRARLFQIFYGVEIETKKTVFDQSTAQIMTNLKATKSHCQFDYILPFSSHHALVEVTQFSHSFFPPENLKAECDKILQQYNCQFSIKRIESAVLPMGIDYKGSKQSSPLLFSQQQGTLRASSGYGFLRIQRQAELLARQIANQKKISNSVLDSRVDRWMDSCFCRVLQKQMTLSPSLFTRMAAHLNAQEFAYFMNGKLSWPLRLRVIKAMPSWPFLRAIR